MGLNLRQQALKFILCFLPRWGVWDAQHMALHIGRFRDRVLPRILTMHGFGVVASIDRKETARDSPQCA